MPLSQDQRLAIAEALERAGATAACPRCGHRQWTVHPHLSVVPLADRAAAGGGWTDAPPLPAAVLICPRCGFVAQHSLRALGIPL